MADIRSIDRGLALGLVAGAAVVLTAALTPEPMIRVAVLSVAAITMIAARALPDAATALFVFIGFLALGAAPPEVIFSGFATGGFWLLIGGLVIGTAITSSGLGDQIAARLFARTGTSYVRAIWLLSVCGVVLGVLVPSAIPRVIILIPITLSLARIMGYAPGSRGYAGLTITAASMTLTPTYAILTANLPTIVELGAVEALYGAHIGYGDYVIQNLPINVVRFVVLLVLLLSWRPSDAATPVPASHGMEPLTPAQGRLLALLGLAVALWATDSLHGIAPAWITLAAAAVLLWPPFGLLGRDAMKSEVDLSIAFLIAAVFCISAVVSQSGLGAMAARVLVPVLGIGEGGTLWDLTAIAGFSSVLSHLTTAPAAPVLLAPLAGSMAEAADWPVITVAMAQNVGLSTVVLPHQSPPLLIALAVARIPFWPLVTITAASAVLSSVVGLPLTWAWWHWLGLI